MNYCGFPVSVLLAICPNAFSFADVENLLLIPF